MAAATRAVDGGAGVLHIVKNYTGDVLNFRLAAELAEDDGIRVESVLMDDDVAVEDSLYTAGRRGTGATVLAEKIAGARAEEGGSLDEVAAVARKVNERARSFGIALSSCATPEKGSPIFELGADEIEVGVGIHGEPGRRREKHGPAADIAEMMVTPILDDLAPSPGTSVLAFVNGLGGTPLIELYLLFNEVNRQLGTRDIRIGRSLVGNYITSLEMAGASITLLVLNEELERLWNAPVATAALRWGV
jgi:dihydroxyacetone kinase-like protein